MSDTHATSGNIHTNGAHENSSDNNATPIFIGLRKTTQITRMPQQENSESKDKE
jgi:hypothetical protein